MTGTVLLGTVLVFSFQPDYVSDRACGPKSISLLQSAQLQIAGHCETTASTRTLHITVTATALSETGPLQDFSLGFCGYVVSAAAPPGWAVTVLRASTEFGKPAEVEWKRLDIPATISRTPSVARTEGFLVTLRPGWRLAIHGSATWQHGASGGGSPHDCGEYPKPKSTV
jgi:hypothetical protein